jgi:hypothetical protein
LWCCSWPHKDSVVDEEDGVGDAAKGQAIPVKVMMLRCIR